MLCLEKRPYSKLIELFGNGWNHYFLLYSLNDSFANRCLPNKIFVCFDVLSHPLKFVVFFQYTLYTDNFICFIFYVNLYLGKFSTILIQKILLQNSSTPTIKHCSSQKYKEINNLVKIVPNYLTYRYTSTKKPVSYSY